MLVTSFLAIACALAASPARAGPYADELGKCLVQSTTRADREALVRWMFAALASHPAVKSVALVSRAQMDEANRVTGELFMRLLTTQCKDAAVRAIQYEGAGALDAGFQVLGQVAGRELMSSPDVAASMAGLEKHLDKDRLQSLAKQPAGTGR
jgi:hypothetical protein